MSENAHRAAVYCRVAREDTFALEAQRSSLRKFAQDFGYNDCEEYLDNGASGLTLERPAFTMLEADVRAGRIDTVIISNISRVSRDYFTFHRWLKGTQALGVTVISQCDGILDSAGGLLDGLLDACVL